MSVEQLKKEIQSKMKAADSLLTQNQRMQIAINLDIALATVVRYLGGEVRRLELAESILNEAGILLNPKAVA